MTAQDRIQMICRKLLLASIHETVPFHINDWSNFLTFFSVKRQIAGVNDISLQGTFKIGAVSQQVQCFCNKFLSGVLVLHYNHIYTHAGFF
jgi:hypothetical protein